jgi:hypothetical protein
MIFFHYCPLNCALSQFLFCLLRLPLDSTLGQLSTPPLAATKICANAQKMHTFFYKYATYLRLLSFSKYKLTHFVEHVII